MFTRRIIKKNPKMYSSTPNPQELAEEAKKGSSVPTFM